MRTLLDEITYISETSFETDENKFRNIKMRTFLDDNIYINETSFEKDEMLFRNRSSPTGKN